MLRKRRMIRSYDEARPVPPDALEAVLAAALRAPSAGFTQGVSLSRAELSGASVKRSGVRPLRRTAPGCAECGQHRLLVLVWTSEDTYLDRYAEPDKGWTDRDPARWSAPYWYVDAGMASMAALLAAVDQDSAPVSSASRFSEFRPFAKPSACRRTS